MKDFVLNNWYYILYCVLAIIAEIVTITNLFKAKKQAKDTKEIAVDREAIQKEIDKLIEEAEKFRSFKGEEKKAYVMTRAIQISKGIMTNSEIDEYIEDKVKLTDTVNKHN